MRTTNLTGVNQRAWDVMVNRNGTHACVGRVFENTELMARCAAVCLFGVGEDAIRAGIAPPQYESIYPQDEFHVVAVQPKRPKNRITDSNLVIFV